MDNSASQTQVTAQNTIPDTNSEVSTNNNGLPPLPQESKTETTVNTFNNSTTMDNNVNKLPPLPDESEEKKEKHKKSEEKEKVIERVIIKEKVRRGGLFNTGCGFRSIGCSGCFLIIVLIVLLVGLFITKPKGIWEKTVNFLNSDVSVPEYDGTTYESAVSTVNTQIEDVGENIVYITEDQLTAFGRENIPQLKEMIIDIEEGKLRIYWNIDSSIENKPLVGVIELQKNSGGELYITHFGTNRVSTPGFVNKYLTNVLFAVLNLGTKNNTSNAFLVKLVSLSENVEIKDVSFADDGLNLTVNVNVDLFD
jgi:hypothetical protein